MLSVFLFISSLWGADLKLRADVRVYAPAELSKSSVTQNFIVQFKKPVLEVDKKKLRKYFEVLAYIPDNALLIRGDVSLLKSLSLDVLAAPYTSHLKWGSGLSARSIFSQHKKESVLIKIFKAEDLKSFLRFLSSIQVDPLSVSHNVLVIQAAHIVLSQVAERYEVEEIQGLPQIESFDFRETDNDIKPYSYDKLAGTENGIFLTGFDKNLNLSQRGAGQTIAFSDTGFDLGDISSSAEVKNLIYGQNFLGESGWADVIGHGTHVTGLVAANGLNSQGLLEGMSPHASVVVQSIYSSVQQKIVFPAHLWELFSSSAKKGAYVHSNSWGSTQDLGAYDIMAQQVDEFLFSNPEHIVVFSAGNEGKDLNRDGRIDECSIASPATSKNVIAVGASENFVKGGIQKPVLQWGAAPFSWPVDPIRSDRVSDNPNGIAMFSSRGPTRDGRIKPDFVAPGTNLLSLRSQHPYSGTLWGIFDEHYIWGGGTSMAAPLVAGAASLVRQWLGEVHNIHHPSGALVKAVLATTAVDLYPGQFGEGGVENAQEILSHRPEINQGFGRISGFDLNLFKGLLIDSAKGVAQDEFHEYFITLESGASLTASLVWYDAPALVSSSEQLVNNLDLVLVFPSGHQEVLQNTKDPFEFFAKTDLIQGTYTIRVKGARVPMGRNGSQPYSLVISYK